MSACAEFDDHPTQIVRRARAARRVTTIAQVWDEARQGFRRTIIEGDPR
jgi:hypothetical protein